MSQTSVRVFGAVVLIASVVTSTPTTRQTHRPTTTVRLHVGGPISETGSRTGIHWQMNRANVVDLEILGDPSDIETIATSVGPMDGGSR
jgi:hypothetical protein